MSNPDNEYSFPSLFIILTFMISWICWLSVVILSYGSDNVVFEPLIYLGIFGPFIASLIVIRSEKGKEGIKDLIASILKWDVSIPWILAAFFLPVFLYIGAVAIDFVIEGNLPFISTMNGIDVILLLLYSIFLSGGFEEPGWRGYALPNLESRHGAIRASIVLGFIWAIWHLPLFLITGYAVSGGSLIGLLLMAVPIALLFTWIYDNTQSVLMCIIMHSTMNFLGNLLFVSPDNQLFGLIYLLLLWSASLILALRYLRN